LSTARSIVSPPVATEILEVIGRPEVVRLFRRVPLRDPAAVRAVLAEAEPVEIDLATIPRVCRDAKADKVLATAKAGGASFIVSEDDDLLVLGEYDGIRIVNAETFLRILDARRAGGAPGDG
jgi:predicted nucleic acid-binding protein